MDREVRLCSATSLDKKILPTVKLTSSFFGQENEYSAENMLNVS